jgi:hypothetical protein
VASQEDSGRKPVYPLGTPLCPTGRDGLRAAVLQVVYNAATNYSDYHQEAHNRDSRPHDHIFPDSGF